MILSLKNGIAAIGCRRRNGKIYTTMHLQTVLVLLFLQKQSKKTKKIKENESKTKREKKGNR